jgi:hypothetical protein
MKMHLKISCGLVLWIAAIANAHSANLIQEGKGTDAVYIGEPVSAVTDKLGPPSDSLYGFVYIYKLPDGTRLSYRLNDLEDKKIASISVAGPANSTYQTKAGARFGMKRKDIEALYGPPDAEVANKIFYNTRGIGFFFTDGVVNEMSVFAPH